LHGETLSQSIPSIGGGTLQGILMVGIIMFVVLMPFFAFRELDRVIGTEELRCLLFGDETKADGAPSIMRRRWRTAAAVALAVLVLGGGWLTWSLRRRTTADYVTQKLETVSAARTVTASGIVGPAAIAPVVVRVSGVIQLLDCDAKMKVKAGQVCAKIDPRPYQIIVDRNKSDLGRAEARFEKDKADLAQAKAAFDHAEALAKRRKAIEKARKAYEQAQARTKLDEATVGQLQAALDAAEIDLGSTEVVSPIDGIVLSRNVKMDQTVAPGSETSPLFLIAADLAVIHIDAEASEKDIGEVKQGDKATFTVDSLPNRPFAGEVTQIRQSPQIDDGATYNVVISAANPDLLLEPGMTATIRILID
jgi:RND family efflux transporter MFP subunit